MIIEPRAAAIIYNLLMSFSDDKIFLLPSNVCPIVPMTFFKAKRRIEFIDISNDTLCMDEEKVLAALKRNPDRYAGVFFVRTFGVNDSFETFFEQIKAIKEEFIIIDDRCLSVPALNEVKTYADATLYSSGYSKIVDIGFGGYAQIKGHIKYSKQYMGYSEEDHNYLIQNYKKSIDKNLFFHYTDSNWLNNDSVIVSSEEYFNLIEQEYTKSINIRSAINKIYSDNLPFDIQLDSRYQVWRFNIRVPNRDAIVEALFRNNLFASTHYASLNGIFAVGKAANAEKLHSSIINLFNNRDYTEEKAYKTVEVIKRYLDVF
ncbi:hypothetical protein [Candidatus Pristimantibacillus sp. PTI5]|uniref:hypothetical protein n=1 Tax=Candidatus Pristimantibacillus sp. PTI5 TaxID=3400422 RepID=UPI003B02E5D9